MGLINLSSPTVGLPDATEEPKIPNDFSLLQAWANGNIDAVNLSPTLAQSIGATQSGAVTKGATNIPGSESRTNTAYGLLATPDQVSNIVLPANGLIAVWYQATWQQSASQAAKAAIFVGSNQLKIGVQDPSGSVISIQEAWNSSTSTASNFWLTSSQVGLLSSTHNNYPGDVTTGQALGGYDSAWSFAANTGYQNAPLTPGLCYIFAAAGTYSIAVMFKASSGSVTVSGRKLWVSAIAFA